jgi:hypothetical protein
VNPARALAFCVLSCATWLGATGAGCTDGTTPDCMSPESGCGPGFDGPPPESASDAGSDQASDATMDGTPDVTPDVQPDAKRDVAPDVTPDATPDVTPDAPTSDGGIACHEHLGAGKTLECNYALTATSSCPAGYTPGHCSSKNLAGCCVTGPTAVCFYNSDVPLPSVDETACTTAGHTWVTTPP